MKTKNNRTRLISLIHAQKTAAGLSDDSYRILIAGAAAGKSSSKDCSMQELLAVFNTLNTVLTNQGQKRYVYIPRRQFPLLQEAVTARAENVLGPDYQYRLDGFLARIKTRSLADCTDKQLRQVMGFISTIERKKHATDRL